MILFVSHGHTIEIQSNTAFTAVERVLYDRREVSRHSSLVGSTHTFVETEEGQEARYEVKIGFHLSSTGFVSVEVKRNGELLLSVNAGRAADAGRGETP